MTRAICPVPLALAAAALVGVHASSAMAGVDCPPNASGSCIELHDEPGCGNPVCCAAVCQVIFSCCEVSWDEICIEVANDVCANTSCPAEGACDEVHDGVGCDEYVCCDFTCSFDGFCCYAVWDAWCVDQALQLCPPAICALAVPPGAIDEVEPCTERLNDGCNLIAAPAFSLTSCGATVTGVCTTGAPRDTDWWSFTLTEPTVVTVTLSAEFPAEALLVRGPCSQTSTLARTATSDCAPSAVTVTLQPGQHWLVVSTATQVRPLHSGIECADDDPETPPPFYGVRYVASLSCAEPGGPADLNGDGLVDGADLGLLLAAWGAVGGGGRSADLDASGVVDGADLGLLLAAWTG